MSIHITGISKKFNYDTLTVMNEKTLSIIVKAKDDASKTISSVGDTAKKVNEQFISMAKVAGIAGVAAAAAFSVSAVKNAIDLNESINAVEKTFGDASKVIFDFGEQAAETAGLSKAALNAAVVPIGAMLRNMGYDADSAAQSSVELGKRAADLASVFNTSLDDALTAIQAGLRGEADPLERFGVGLSDASVQAYAVSNGISTAGKEMTAQQKTVARLGLLFDQTSRFAGDFVDTSDQVANKQRILQARFENQSAEIGKRLVPAWSALLDAGQKILPKFADIANAIASQVVPAMNTLENVVKAIGPIFLVAAAGFTAYQVVMTTARGVITAVTLAQNLLNAAIMANPLGLIIAGLTAVVTAFALVQSSTNGVTSAQERLNAANQNAKVAADNLKDAEMKLTDARLAREGSDIAVQRAEERLNELKRDGKASALDLKEAEYNLEVAKNNAADASNREADAVRNASKAKDDDRRAKDEVVKANNDVANSAANAAGQYQNLADRVNQATKAMKEGNGAKQVDALFGLPVTGGTIPRKAGGGPVSANRPYFVGDNPDGSLNNTSELFVPKTSGTIVNSKDLQSALGSGGETNINFLGNITLASASAVDRLFERLGVVKELGEYGVGV